MSTLREKYETAQANAYNAEAEVRILKGQLVDKERTINVIAEERDKARGDKANAIAVVSAQCDVACPGEREKYEAWVRLYEYSDEEVKPPTCSMGFLGYQAMLNALKGVYR